MPSPLQIGAYLSGSQPALRAVFLFWILGTIALSLVYYFLEFEILTPDPNSWAPLLRWMRVSYLANWAGVFVALRCNRNTNSIILSAGLLVFVAVAQILLAMLAFPWVLY